MAAMAFSSTLQPAVFPAWRATSSQLLSGTAISLMTRGPGAIEALPNRIGAMTKRSPSSVCAPNLSALPTSPSLQSAVRAQIRHFRTKGVLKLHCSECRYVIRKRNVPILGVDCNANVRHKQLMSNPPKQSRVTPDWLLPWLEGKQYPRHPHWKMDFTHTYFTKFRYVKNTHW